MNQTTKTKQNKMEYIIINDGEVVGSFMTKEELNKFLSKFVYEYIIEYEYDLDDFNKHVKIYECKKVPSTVTKPSVTI